jgi:hypothetical protein
VKVVQLRQSLVRSGCAQEVDVLVGIVLAEGQLVDLLLAAQQMRVALEQALLQVVEDRHAQRLHAQSNSSRMYALAA